MSVLPRTWPRPGKCFTAVATPTPDMPRTNAVALGSTSPALLPSCRSKRPIGPLVRGSGEVGTTSPTGARSRLTPAARSWRAHCRACACSRAGDQRLCTRAEGIGAKPGPVSVCTSPPSWSVATSSGTPPVAGPPIAALAPRVTPALARTPRPLRPWRKTLPTWLPASSCSTPGEAPGAGTPTISSCPTCWRSVSRSSTRRTSGGFGRAFSVTAGSRRKGVGVALVAVAVDERPPGRAAGSSVAVQPESAGASTVVATSSRTVARCAGRAVAVMAPSGRVSTGE